MAKVVLTETERAIDNFMRIVVERQKRLLCENPSSEDVNCFNDLERAYHDYKESLVKTARL